MANYRSLVEYIVGGLRFCVLCGAGVGTRTSFQHDVGTRGSPYCSFCLIHIFGNRSKTNPIQNDSSGYKFKTRYLFQWNDSNDFAARRTLLKFKGCKWASNYYWFADQIVEQAMKESKDSSEINPIHSSGFQIVPAPPRVGRQIDHAGSFAEALSQRLSFPVVSVLERLTQEEQKRKIKVDRWRDLEQRFRRSLLSEVPFTIGEKILFVDDLVTTGATAWSAYIALGQPKTFEVWSIIQRPRLRRTSDFDITPHHGSLT